MRILIFNRWQFLTLSGIVGITLLAGSPKISFSQTGKAVFLRLRQDKTAREVVRENVPAAAAG